MLADKIEKLRTLIQRRDAIDAEIEALTGGSPKRGRPRKADRNGGEADTDAATQVETSA